MRSLPDESLWYFTRKSRNCFVAQSSSWSIYWRQYLTWKTRRSDNCSMVLRVSHRTANHLLDILLRWVLTGLASAWTMADGSLSEGYGHDGPDVCLGDGQTKAYLKDMDMMGLASAWAMARRKPIWRIWTWWAWRLPWRWPDESLSEGYGHDGPDVCLGDGQTEAEGVSSQGGRGDAPLRRTPPYPTWPGC